MVTLFGRRGGPGASPREGRVAPLGAARALGSVFVLLVFVPPLVLLVSGSFYEPGQPPKPRPDLIPEPASTLGYQLAFEWGGLLRAGVNSLIVAIVAVPLSVLVASAAGFALIHVVPWLRRLMIGASIVVLMIPAIMVVVPRFAFFRTLGLTDTLAPLVAPALIGSEPLYPLAFYLAFRALPRDTYDACRIEDLSPWRTWWSVAMPQVRPVTAGVTAMTFVFTWSNLLDPLVYLYDRNLYTLPLALKSLSTLDATNFPVFLAGAVLATLPALVVYGFAQRRFLR